MRASETFQRLLADLVDAENQVYARRVVFNEAVKSYNMEFQQFPNVIAARAMGFNTRDYETLEQHL